VAAGGFRAEVSGAADGEMKERWGKLYYLWASLEVARNFDVRDSTVITHPRDRTTPAIRSPRRRTVPAGFCGPRGGSILLLSYPRGSLATT
jgi:hypothetical protein